MSDAALEQNDDWAPQGFRQRLGSRIERHVLRNAVELLDERGAELDTIERELVEREQDLLDRIAFADGEEAKLERRERRLAEVGATDVAATRQIDHLVAQLDRAEAAATQLRAEAEQRLSAAAERTRELQERVKRLEEHEHRRVLSAADVMRRESAVASREHELREQNERLREREEALERRASELEKLEDELRAQQRRWWRAGPGST